MNWALPWHQDRTIAVRRRIHTDGYGPWTVKNGIMHVEPPIEITQRMLTLRLHLDEVDSENAPLLIVPGSHLLGRIPTSGVMAVVKERGAFTCFAQAGDIWAYSTGILHASSAATIPRRRRVLHIDFAAFDLPGELDWLGIGEVGVE